MKGKFTHMYMSFIQTKSYIVDMISIVANSYFGADKMYL